MVSFTGLLAAAFIAPQLVAASPLFTSANKAGSEDGLAKRGFTKDASISDEDFKRFEEEYAAARGIAAEVARMADFEDNFYWDKFMPQADNSKERAKEYQNVFLQKFQEFGEDKGVTVTVKRIKGETGGCQKDKGRVPYAFVDGLTLTLCDAFIAQPPTAIMNCNERTRSLDEYETGAMTILHEFTHFEPAYFSLKTFGTAKPPFFDHAWGSTAAAELAESNGAAAVVNPDNWMFMTMGAYWRSKCKYDIPSPPAPASPKDEPEC